ncbi:MAG: hypothetical protein MK102_16410 [Fuerstiella sp.]|nr:hypothetical protein [Fuerstiella sp.]
MIARTCHFCLILFAVVMVSNQHAAHSQTIQAELNRGFVRSSSIILNVKEMLGTQVNRAEGESILGPGFPALWIAEVQYKPVRLLRLPVRDSRTQETKRELVWYMVYRVIPRDYTYLAGSEESRLSLLKRLRNETVDSQDQRVIPESLAMPRFTLQTTDEGAKHIYVDEVNHEVQQAVFSREFRDDAKDLQLLNSIEAISAVDVGKQVKADDPDALENAHYGVAIWRNVDPETDFFRVIMSGFSNAYRLTSTEDGKIQVEDKCIVQEFGRPGDRFAQSDREFRVEGDPKWIYLPRKDTIDIPGVISVLGNRAVDPTVR